MLNKTTRLLGLVALGVLTGCGGGGGGTPAPAEPAATVVAKLQTSGAMLTLDRTATLAGTDANGDGVRDDVTSWITAQAYTAGVGTAANQLAKAYQSVLTVSLTDDAALRAARLASSDAVECVMQKADTVEAGYKIVADLRRVTINTTARVDAYLAYAEKVNDTVARAPQDDGCTKGAV
jgi:NADPH:quinone reductase-like Zn-dependent oxidoreductase